MRNILIVILCVLLLAGCGGSSAPPTSVQAAPPPPPPPPPPSGTDFVAQVPSDTPLRCADVRVEWDYFLDPATGRLVVLGAAGGSDATGSVPVTGVPAGCAYPLPFPPPGWPWTRFCLDTFKLGSKQPRDAFAVSILVISSKPGRGRPSISVVTDDGDIHAERLCWDTTAAPERAPHIWLINNWDQVQVMTFVLAGEVRP